MLRKCDSESDIQTEDVECIGRYFFGDFIFRTSFLSSLASADQPMMDYHAHLVTTGTTDAIEGVTPHSCQHCSQISICPDRYYADDNDNGRSNGHSHVITLAAVFDAARSGCPLFTKEAERAWKIWMHDTIPVSLVIQPCLLVEGDGFLGFRWYDNDERLLELYDDDGSPVNDGERRMFALAGMFFPALFYVPLDITSTDSDQS